MRNAITSTTTTTGADSTGKHQSDPDSIFAVLNLLDLDEAAECLHEMFLCYVRSLGAESPASADTHDTMCTVFMTLRQIILERKFQENLKNQ